MSEAEAARLEGNALYKEGKAKEALTAYSKALRALADPKADSALAIHKNMAACYIKLVRPRPQERRKRTKEKRKLQMHRETFSSSAHSSFLSFSLSL